MTVTQLDKANRFRALHEAPGAFVIANVWDGGSARMMAGVGFAALATSSGASAGLLGRRGRRGPPAGAVAPAGRGGCARPPPPGAPGFGRGFGGGLAPV